MLIYKGFSIIPKKISVTGEKYFGKCSVMPFRQIYDTKEEAEIALKENKMCYFTPENLEVKQVEVTIYQ